MNLFNRVGQIFYGFEKTKFEKQRRLGKPRTPHNKYLCQACLEGICLSKRRACAATGQSITVCSNQDNTNRDEDDDETTNESEHVSSSDEGEIENALHHHGDVSDESQIEPMVKLFEEDDGDYSEDSGILEIESELSSKNGHHNNDTTTDKYID